MIKEGLSLSEIQKLINEFPAVVLYFYSDKCQPCMQLRPKVEDLISRFREIKLIFIDAEKMPEICGHFGIFSSPTILLFFDGKENQRFSKYVSVDQLHEAIARPYRMMFGD